MSLKSLRDNYGKLLNSFSEAGIKLTESQKKDIDNFMLTLESNIEDTKKKTIKATREVVEKNMEKKFQQVFESIMKHKAKLDEISSKIQKKVIQIKESKKMAKKVDRFLNEALEEALPNKEIVNHKKLQKLETLMESMKELLVVNDETLEQKSEELSKKYSTQIDALNKKVSSLTDKLNESIKKEIQLKTRLNAAKAEKLLNEKLNDLPSFEARQVRSRLQNASVDEINANFKKVLESVHQEMKADAELEDKSLKEEIQNIIETEDSSSSSSSSDKKTDKVAKADEKTSKKTKDGSDDAETDSSDDGTDDTSEDEVEEYEDVELDESEKIDSRKMQEWINLSNSIKPLSLNL